MRQFKRQSRWLDQNVAAASAPSGAGVAAREAARSVSRSGACRGWTGRAWKRAVGLVAVLSICALAVGCASKGRPELTEAELQQRAAEDLAQSRETLAAATGKIIARIEREIAQSGDSESVVLDFLAMSGGGDAGAFGAGILVGWGEQEDPAWHRPDFDVVTGVSTGALLAPFAYVGTDEACRFVEGFYRAPKKDWLRNRGWFFFLPWNPSFMTIPGLERDIRATVDMPFVEQVAEQSRNGKVLVISATDLDLGYQRYWSVGAEAEAAVASGDPERVQNIMLASSSVPAVFPPVEIDGSVYADGGITANVLLRLDPYSPEAVLPRWRAAHPDTPLPKVRYWIVINNQLQQLPKTVQVKWPAIVSPSLATAIRSATIAEVRWLAAQADYVNSQYDTDIEVRVVSIPNDWRPPVSGNFKKETMQSLADLGRAMGADPASWTLWTRHEQDAGEADSTRR